MQIVTGKHFPRGYSEPYTRVTNFKSLEDIEFERFAKHRKWSEGKGESNEIGMNCSRRNHEA